MMQFKTGLTTDEHGWTRMKTVRFLREIRLAKWCVLLKTIFYANCANYREFNWRQFAQFA